MFPFMFNKWHVQTAMNNDRLWVVLLTIYRMVSLVIFIAAYYLIKYLIHAIF